VEQKGAPKAPLDQPFLPLLKKVEQKEDDLAKLNHLWINLS